MTRVESLQSEIAEEEAILKLWQGQRAKYERLCCETSEYLALLRAALALEIDNAPEISR
jgi:hypothetical protein